MQVKQKPCGHGEKFTIQDCDACITWAMNSSRMTDFARAEWLKQIAAVDLARHSRVAAGLVVEKQYRR